MRLVLAAVALLMATLPAQAQNAGRYGNTICVTGGVTDACAPLYPLPAGSYAVKYTGSLQPPRNQGGPNTDDNSILDCGPNNTGPVTITLPTSTSSVFPPGHGVGVKNSGSTFTCVVTVAGNPNTSIYGAGGIVNGSPAAVGGPIAIFPGGEAYFTVDKNNKWVVTGLVPGVWFKTVNGAPAASLQFTSIQGYPMYDLNCMTMIPTANATDTLRLQMAYAGTFQSTGYNWLRTEFQTQNGGGGSGPTMTSGTTSPSSSGDTSGIVLTNLLSNYGPTQLDGAQFSAKITAAAGTGGGYRYGFTAIAAYNFYTTGQEAQSLITGAGPYTMAGGSLTGLQLYDGGSGSNLNSGMCWLRPSL